jgi:hypothetical protein
MRLFVGTSLIPDLLDRAADKGEHPDSAESALQAVLELPLELLDAKI